jgi:DNA-directed RNA polymerase II subunit RPB2
MYPNDARLGNLTYAANLYADVLIEYRKDGKVLNATEFPRMRIGSLPIMLHSSICILRGQAPQVLREMGECPFDQGGYFVITGKEKVLIAQERIAYNRLFITRMKENQANVHAIDAFIRCMPPSDLFPKLLRFRVFREDNRRRSAIVCMMPRVSGDIPLFALFRALGVESDEDIMSLVSEGNPAIRDFLYDSAVDCSRLTIYTQPKALELLSTRSGLPKSSKVKSFLINNVLPNAGIDFEEKASTCFGIPKTTAVKLSARGNSSGRYIRVSIHHMKHDIPLFVLIDIAHRDYTAARSKSKKRP